MSAIQQAHVIPGKLQRVGGKKRQLDRMVRVREKEVRVGERLMRR